MLCDRCRISNHTVFAKPSLYVVVVFIEGTTADHNCKAFEFLICQYISAVYSKQLMLVMKSNDFNLKLYKNILSLQKTVVTGIIWQVLKTAEFDTGVFYNVQMASEGNGFSCTHALIIIIHKHNIHSLLIFKTGWPICILKLKVYTPLS